MIPRYFLEELLVTSIRTDGVSFSSDQIQNIADSFRGKPLYTAYATENAPQSFRPFCCCTDTPFISKVELQSGTQ